MGYLAIRQEYSLDLRLVGGINADAWRGDKETIRHEVEEKCRHVWRFWSKTTKACAKVFYQAECRKSSSAQTGISGS
jgi:hypothetical protein